MRDKFKTCLYDTMRVDKLICLLCIQKRKTERRERRARESFRKIKF